MNVDVQLRCPCGNARGVEDVVCSSCWATADPQVRHQCQSGATRMYRTAARSLLIMHATTRRPMPSRPKRLTPSDLFKITNERNTR